MCVSPESERTQGFLIANNKKNNIYEKDRHDLQRDDKQRQAVREIHARKQTGLLFQLGRGDNGLGQTLPHALEAPRPRVVLLRRRLALATGEREHEVSVPPCRRQIAERIMCSDCLFHHCLLLES